MTRKYINIAILPARIGSKRIKKKNIKFFNGKPILAWTFQILDKSNLFLPRKKKLIQNQGYLIKL